MNYNIFSHRDKDIFLEPGDIYIVRSNRRVVTILGTCISIILYSPTHKKGGIFHAMLPEVIEKYRYNHHASAKYVDYAFYYVLNHLLKNGVSKKSLEAKIFGGASVLSSCQSVEIGIDNIRVGKKLLLEEGIRTVSIDVGGTQARKIVFYPETGDVYMKYITNNLVKI